MCFDMAKDDRRKQLEAIFQNVDANERILVDRLIDEVVYLEERMTELRGMEFIRVHPTDKSVMKTTAAAKQYKECSQSYMNAVRILINVLRKVESSAADELLKRLEEFT